MNRTIKDWEMRITWKKSEESKKWKHASTWDEGNGGENADLFASEHWIAVSWSGWWLHSLFNLSFW
jgi:hypothetical protein